MAAKSKTVTIPSYMHTEGKKVLKALHAKEPLTNIRTCNELYREILREGLEKYRKKYNP